jgi:GTP-binding protein YchF
MKIGIIGLPQSGKTTIFNAAAGQSEAVGDFSKASHRAVVKVPDPRLDRLAELVTPKKVVHAEITYIDSGAFTGKGKQADAAAIEIPEDIRYADALMVVVDCFSPDAKPEHDFNLFNEEMILADQIVVERTLHKRERAAQLAADKEAVHEADVLKKCLASLESEKPLSSAGLSVDERRILSGYTFLSIKPLLVVLNIVETDIGKERVWADRFGNLAIPGAREFVALCGKIEMELAVLGTDDRAVFLADLGIERPAMDLLIRKSQSLLGLISFFTYNEQEAHAWTTPAGTPARRAAGTVHSDMERGFIRAEVIKFEDFDRHGSVHAVKEAGKFHVEGKDYIVSDGDIVLIRFNV